MSIKAMVWYLDNSPLMGNDKLTMVILADYADDEGECFPGHKRIAHRLNMSESGARKILYRLREEGEIEIEEGSGVKTKTGNTNRYRLMKYRDSLKGVPMGTVSHVGHPRVSQAKDTHKGARVSQAKDSDPSVILNPQIDPSDCATHTDLPKPRRSEATQALLLKHKELLQEFEPRVKPIWSVVEKQLKELSSGSSPLTPAEYESVFRELKQDKFWQDKPLSPATVGKQAGAILGRINRIAAINTSKEVSVYAQFG